MTERMTAQQLIEAFEKARQPRGQFIYLALLFLLPSGCIERINGCWDWRKINALIEEAVTKNYEPMGIMGIREDLTNPFTEPFTQEDRVSGYIREEIEHVEGQIRTKTLRQLKL
jgi:hypothetical protein